MARAQPGERDAVTMLWIHVRLNLEHKPRDLFFFGIHLSHIGRLSLWRRGEVSQPLQQFLYTEVVERAAEEDPRPFPERAARGPLRPRGLQDQPEARRR